MNEVINALVENLYLAISDSDGAQLEVYSIEKLARAYSIAKQLYEFGTVDAQETEDFVNDVTAEGYEFIRRTAAK